MKDTNLKANLHPSDVLAFIAIEKVFHDFQGSGYMGKNQFTLVPLSKWGCMRYYGMAEYPGTVELGLRFVDKASKRWGRRHNSFQIADTIVHEIAHLLDEKGHEHNEIFSNKFVFVWALARSFRLHGKIDEILTRY